MVLVPIPSSASTATVCRANPFRVAVYEYLRSGALDAETKESALRKDSIVEVLGWPLQDRFRGHKLFAYPRNLRHDEYEIVAVDNEFHVWPLADRREFNELLQREGIRVLSESDALLTAQLFLKVYFVSQVIDYGWELGVNVVSSLDEIDFTSDEERREFEREITIARPLLTKQGSVFEYVLYSWKRFGSGLLSKHIVRIDENGIQDLDSRGLKNDVGRWRGLR